MSTLIGVALGSPIFMPYVRQLIDSDPRLIAKSMQQHQNAEVREYGYRIELALEKDRKYKKEKRLCE